MPKRHCCNSYIGLYARRSRSSQRASSASRTTAVKLHCLWKNVTDYLSEKFCTLCDNYATIIVIFAVLLLSLFIPTIVKTIYNTAEIKGLKKMLDLMTKEVNQAKTDCLKVADEICSIHCSMRDVETEMPRNRLDCPSCERLAKSKSVQASKRNFFQRLFRINQSSSQNIHKKSPPPPSQSPPTTTTTGNKSPSKTEKNSQQKP